ncbi:hypothetical protein CXG81DRAFT_17999 [Caulochytrium protostelioides]|uniref:CID domain-containing protein n=1 Tax=Caulochytrium protostelioides TaxID=1555241 RepID=A0A4P9XAE6_9FUNG|nr:hypothetical protein CXG81DRAFT_17999 [Caulochytrium protostelioides]|eukprot:RKP02334.1 hypothetical protein CXG81DRAFT_17999 [Caulochytrium protostelioides]
MSAAGGGHGSGGPGTPTSRHAASAAAAAAAASASAPPDFDASLALDHFRNLLTRCSTSERAITAVVGHATAHAAYAAELWTIFMTRLRAASSHERQNMFFILDALMRACRRSGEPRFAAVIQADFPEIVELVAPPRVAGGVNLPHLRRLLAKWREHAYVPATLLDAAAKHLEYVEASVESMAATALAAAHGELVEAAQTATAAARAKAAAQHAASATPMSVDGEPAQDDRAVPVPASPPPVKPFDVLLMHNGPLRGNRVLSGFSEEDIARRIEEDRDRHKRAREEIWSRPTTLAPAVAAPSSPPLAAVAAAAHPLPETNGAADPDSRAVRAAEAAWACGDRRPGDAGLSPEFDALWDAWAHPSALGRRDSSPARVAATTTASGAAAAPSAETVEAADAAAVAATEALIRKQVWPRDDARSLWVEHLRCAASGYQRQMDAVMRLYRAQTQRVYAEQMEQMQQQMASAAMAGAATTSGGAGGGPSGGPRPYGRGDGKGPRRMSRRGPRPFRATRR